jgi:hypothetical protein
MTLRQNISSNLKKSDTDYFFVDEKGNLNPVSYKFVNFFSKYIKEVREKVASELQTDEAQFNAELKEIGSKYFSTQFLSDRIAFVTATVEDDKTKEKKPVYFYNDNLDVLEQFPVNTQQLQTHINKYMEDSFKTAKEIANTENSTGENQLNEAIAQQPVQAKSGDVANLQKAVNANSTIQYADSRIDTPQELQDAFGTWISRTGYGLNNKPARPISISQVQTLVRNAMQKLGYK